MYNFYTNTHTDECIKKELDLCERCSLSTYISWNNVFCITTTHRQKRMYSFVVLGAVCDLCMIVRKEIVSLSLCTSLTLSPFRPPILRSLSFICHSVRWLFFFRCFWRMFFIYCMRSIRFDRRSVFPMNGDFSTKCLLWCSHFHLTAFWGLPKGMVEISVGALKSLGDKTELKYHTSVEWLLNHPIAMKKHFALTLFLRIRCKRSNKCATNASLWFGFHLLNTCWRKEGWIGYLCKFYTPYSLALSFASHGILFMH